jgi:thioredoxin-like negative regulator of GroEL
LQQHRHLSDDHPLITFRPTEFRRAILCALSACLLAGPALSAGTAELTAEQVEDYERVDDSQRVKLLIHLAISGRQDLAETLLSRYPLQGKHAANRTLFIQGLILKADGDLTGAAKKFRSSLADDPKLTLVRAELAKTLVELEQDDSATHHLRLLAADAPTEQDAAGIRAFVDKVDARRPYRFNAYIAAAPSSNVNNGSSHSTV